MKKIILIGPQDWFADSFVYFIEKGFKGIVIKINNSYRGYDNNYYLLNQLGYKILNVDDLDIGKIGLDENTLVLSGPNFAGDLKSLSNFKFPSMEALEITYNISKYNRENKCGAKVVKWFNGDTGFCSQEMVDFFNYKIKYVDVLIFDNDLMKEFVLKNIPNAKNIKSYVSWLETPLERFVQNNICKKIDKKFISLGRLFSSKQIPVKYLSYDFINHDINRKLIDNIIFGWQSNRIYFILYIFGIAITIKKKLAMPFNLAGGINDISIVYKDRNIFFDKHKKYAFGLSHFYDIFDNSINNFLLNKDFYFSINGQNIANNINAQKELYYQFCNVPSKDITYLMNGIIPVISHNLHNIYRQLTDKKMAILVKQPNDIADLQYMHIDDILEYKSNIYKNRELFTFEKSGELLINLLN